MANETAKKTLKTRIKLKRDMSANWEKANPVLLNGETIIVDTANNETRTKTGDGTKTYTQLPFDDEGTKGGKGLSTCDYTAEDKAEVAKVKSKVNTSDVLTKTNATEFTPTADYQPATKKYVDSKGSSSKKYSTVVIGNSANITIDKVDLLYTVGTDFATVLTQAVDSLPSSGGEVKILAGEYSITTTDEYRVSTVALNGSVKISGEGNSTVINYPKSTQITLYCNYEFCNLKLVHVDSSSRLIVCTKGLYVHDCYLNNVCFRPPRSSSIFRNNTINITSSDIYANGFLDYNVIDGPLENNVYIISDNTFTGYCNVNFAHQNSGSIVVFKNNYISNTITCYYQSAPNVCYVINNIINTVSTIPKVDYFCNNYIKNSKFADINVIESPHHSNNVWQDGIDQVVFANGETIGGKPSTTTV